MTTQDEVRAEAYQNEYLPEGGTVVDAVITVTMGAAGAAAAAVSSTGKAAEIIMIDCSGSMTGPNIRAAREAARVAIDAIRDGVAFAIVAGTSAAQVVYPSGAGMAPASPHARDEAKNAVKRLRAGGGTSFGAWLTVANSLFIREQAEINHAILLTDGANGDGVAVFNATLAACAGHFTCDSRGVGDGWLARDLIKIAEALLGSADGMKNPDELAADFRAMIETAMGKTRADVSLRVWTPAGARIRYVKQVFPDITDLTDRRVDVAARVGQYPIGAWGAESRDYQVSVEVEPNPVGEEVLAARVSVVHGTDILAQCLVRAVWTDDAGYSTRINKRVAQYGGQAELAEAIQEGLEARAAGDLDRATDRLGDAVRLAHSSGRDDTAKMLAGVVDVVDAPTGTVRLRNRNDNADVDIDAEIAAVGSRKTRRVRPD